jgi:hypothetical protein
LKATNELRLLELDNINWDVFNNLHEKLRDKIIKSPEYNKAIESKALTAEEDEVF